MLERGLLPTFSAAGSAELRTVQAPAGASRDSGGDASKIRDLTDLVWASIDNDDSRDLDQLTVAETHVGGTVRIRVAVADVDALVKSGSAIDTHARHNTTSVYTAAEVFPMLPEQLCANLTSLNAGEERLAVVVDMVVGADALVTGASDKGTWARLLTIAVEGRVVRGFEGADVGDQIRVRLMSVNVERGFVDCARVDLAGHA